MSMETTSYVKQRPVKSLNIYDKVACLMMEVIMKSYFKPRKKKIQDSS